MRSLAFGIIAILSLFLAMCNQGVSLVDPPDAAIKRYAWGADGNPNGHGDDMGNADGMDFDGDGAEGDGDEAIRVPITLWS